MNNTARPPDAVISQMRQKVKRFEQERDAILKTRDFSKLADCLDRLDEAQTLLWRDVPEDAPVTDKLTAIFGKWGSAK